MTKTLFSLIPPPLRSICIIALILSLCACSLVNDLSSERASLSFTITGELADRINSASSSRSATLADSGLYLDIALEGGYKDEKTISVSEGSTVKFENIPTGLSVYATAQAYEMDGGEKFVFYEGESEKITIQEGENTLSLFLQKVESDIIRYYISANGSANDSDGSKAKPFKQLANAVEKINDSTKTYWLIVDGILSEPQSLVDTLEDMAGKEIVLKGKTGSSTDIINANAEGCALRINSPVPVTIKNLTITGGDASNDVPKYGGGIYLISGNVTIADGAVIVDNQAQNGGGVYMENSTTLKMTGGVITNNTASSMGGGVCLAQSQNTLFTMTGGEISNNTVTSGDGGGIWVGDWVEKIELSNAKITGNKADNGGGLSIGLTTSGTHKISGCTISGNIAETYGGGIYLQIGTLTINSSIISGNTAEQTNGNDIWKGMSANLPNGPDDNPPNVYYAY